ncbi:hypothetical protein TTHERM_00819590 (macronuclear) [Tetrahymena thermophila SB210]|uniref:Uncharacterized protein n=1 Tax=Tetrahymena thermophila (strain SB210) TaxID=312017 RepID=Q23H87_TETTS|nr:hypothetical protein TTHERM_00819590 [Tetrahymena thermophila SB210]EAR95921.1 hypothetical protein TTHERM_00819590 [Tetrahymena thermophila SB210]|eukprot:XP_001016166.1 hypothetical protein TTHERM_00819590 [Tetrahymena thermophila SB210]
MSVLSNLAKKYYDEEKSKAIDKFTFIFQSEKDEDMDIKQLQTAKVYHIIDEPQFNENDQMYSKVNSRLNSGLQNTINSIKRQKKFLQFNQNQQMSEQQIQRQILFEKKGKEIKENMIQQKKDKVNKIKNQSETIFKQQEEIAKNVIDIHKKGHLVYVDYGESQEKGLQGIKEFKQSPKQSDLEAIAYSDIIAKTQKFLDQEEVYKQIKRDLQFKFNINGDKNDSLSEYYDQVDDQQLLNKRNNSNEIQKKNSISKKIRELVEGDIDFQVTKEQKKKLNKDLLKYLKSESENPNNEIQNKSGVSTTPDKKLKESSVEKMISKPQKILKNSLSAIQGKLKQVVLIDKENNVKDCAENQNKEQNCKMNDDQDNVCKTEIDERQRMKVPLRVSRSQISNSQNRKQLEEEELINNQIQQNQSQPNQLSKELSQKSKNQQIQSQKNQNLENGSLKNLVNQKSKLQNKIEQQKIKFGELLNQIQFITNQKKSSNSPDQQQQLHQTKKQQISATDINLLNNVKKVNENQISVNMAYPNNISSNNSMHGVKLPQIGSNSKQINNSSQIIQQSNSSQRRQLSGQRNFYSVHNNNNSSFLDQNQSQQQVNNFQNEINNNVIIGNQKKVDVSVSSRLKRRNSGLKQNSNKINKNFSALDSSIQSLVDASFVKLIDVKQVKSEGNPNRKNRSHKSLHTNTTANQTNLTNEATTTELLSNFNSQSLNQNSAELQQQSKQSQASSHILTENKRTNKNKILRDNFKSHQIQNTTKNTREQLRMNHSISRIEPSPILQNSTTPITNNDLVGMSFLNIQDNTTSLQENSQSIKNQLNNQSSEILKTNPSQSILNQSQNEKKRVRSKTLHDAEILLNRIKKMTANNHELQEQIEDQINSFSFNKVKQRQIQILKTFKDQKVPDIVKKRLHHDFINILSMCQS